MVSCALVAFFAVFPSLAHRPDVAIETFHARNACPKNCCEISLVVRCSLGGSVPEPDSEVAPPEDDVPSPAHVWRSVFFAVRTLRFHWHLGLRRAQRP